VDSNIDIQAHLCSIDPSSHFIRSSRSSTKRRGPNLIAIRRRSVDDGAHRYLTNGCCHDHSGSDWGLRIFEHHGH